MTVESTSTPAHGQQIESASPSLQDVIAKMSGSEPEVVVAPEEPVEVPEEVVVEEPKPKRDVSASRFGALARKEKELRNQQFSFEQRMKGIEERENGIRERELRFQQAKRPLDKLKEYGFTHADITQDLLGNWKEPELDPLDEKLKPHKEKWDRYESKSAELEAELNQLKTQLTLKEQKETYNQVIGDIQSVLSDNDRYELTNTMGKEGLDLIQEVVIEYFNENEILLDYAAACDIVEEYYEKQIMTKLVGTKKAQSRFAPPAAPKVTTKPSQAPTAPSVPKTLTQSHTTGSQATVDIDSLSKSEALAYLSKKLLYKQD